MANATHAPVDRLVRVDVRKLLLATDGGTLDPTAPSVIVWYSDQEGGTPIDSSLSKTASAIDSQPGCFQASFLGSEFLPFWPQRDGRTVWRCVSLGTHYIEALPFTVAQTR